MSSDERFLRRVAHRFYLVFTASKHLAERTISVLWICVLPVSHFDSTKLIYSPIVVLHVFSHGFFLETENPLAIGAVGFCRVEI